MYMYMCTLICLFEVGFPSLASNPGPLCPAHVIPCLFLQLYLRCSSTSWIPVLTTAALMRATILLVLADLHQGLAVDGVLRIPLADIARKHLSRHRLTLPWCSCRRPLRSWLSTARCATRRSSSTSSHQLLPTPPVAFGHPHRSYLITATQSPSL